MISNRTKNSWSTEIQSMVPCRAANRRDSVSLRQELCCVSECPERLGRPPFAQLSKHSELRGRRCKFSKWAEGEQGYDHENPVSRSGAGREIKPEALGEAVAGGFEQEEHFWMLYGKNERKKAAV